VVLERSQLIPELKMAEPFLVLENLYQFTKV